MSAAEAAIPYEMQSDSHSNRTCGAACLSMVYRSFGKEVPQAEIWPAISKQNRLGSVASTTHLMAQDALHRGFRALAIQARDPLQTLRLCRESGVRAILNHRLNRSVPTGHFTVLVDIDDKDVVLHDPFFGPSRRLSHAELIELWQPRFPNSEVVGNFLIGIAAKPGEAKPCELCHTSIPAEVECPSCEKPVGLQPGVLLRCTNNACIARMWNFVCCPDCDYTWSFTGKARTAAENPASGPSGPASSKPLPSDPPPAAAVGKTPLDLEPMFAQLDKFCNLILSSPAAANHPDIKQHLAAIAASREQLTLARAEAFTHLKAHQEQLATLALGAKQRLELHRKKMEELKRPAPPLDGNALGHALLKNLGFKT